MTSDLTEWVKHRAVAIRSTDPADEDFDDLEPIAEVIGRARVVGFGESTHGTREEARMKHRLLRFLSQRGFTALAFERDMAEMAAFDSTIESTDALGTLPLAFHPWRSTDVLAMLRWMQSERQGGRNLRLFGFDMQQELGPSSLEIVRDHLDASERPVHADDYAQLERNLGDEFWGKVEAEALAAASRLRAAVHDDGEWSSRWAGRHALIVEQALLHRRPVEDEMEAMFQRDACMADHIEWLVDNAVGDARVFVWAHNFHVGRIERYMGTKLAERFGDDYVPIALAFHHGRFRARTYSEEGGAVSAPMDVDALTPEENCIEHAANESPLDRFFVDLRGMPRKGEQALMRVVGERIKTPREVSDEFEPVKLADAFDGLVFMRETTPLDILGWPDQ